ncbi:ketopantoate reductase [Thermanaeromonas toyohensis ToBE]|uniref:2-dehydropantoate 2-reductase n=1 Tax=Thermanaeromonas toyohensis ToBE TaxID=698762 RepID=A0A1W1VYX9_9FIRM|nr:2-dehydropantoate 2-reductase [Thermanaeromonas toyohensis]SMB98460.1 ketopantoate reductase [Thermanaeromonas toyohensis ToBE]
MKIVVLGAGAMGSLFGGLLAEAGQEVWLVDVWQEHVEAINSRGLIIVTPTEERTIKVRAVTNPRAAGEADLVLLFVKSYSTEEALQHGLAVIGQHTVVLTLQNGVGNAEKIERIVGRDKVLVGSTSFGANVMGPGKICHAGSGETYLGELDGSITERLRVIASIFDKADLKPVVTDNVVGVLWTKLLANVGINALTALLKVRNGQLLDITPAQVLMEKAVAEALRIVEAKGIKLVVEDPMEYVKKVAYATGNNISSMRQDVERLRRTEIDVINGAIVKEGETLGIPTPYNETLLLLIKALEATYTH